MTHNMAKQFWNVYLGMAGKDGAHVNMSNPVDDFKERAHAGEFDNLTDDQYYRKEADAEEVASFWDYKPSEMAGIILLNALAKTDISDVEIDDIAGILADASVRTDYYTEERECDEGIINEDLDFSPVDGPTPFDDGAGWTPRSIYNYLNQHIYGQDAAKRAVSMLMYHHLRGNSRNIVMAGATGCGKTEIWRTLSKMYNCIRIINGPQLSCDGWKGSLKISDIFTCETKKLAEHLVLVIDESDKMMEPKVASGGTDYAKMIQNELLKVMDGDTLTFTDEKNRDTKTTINCSGVSVVLCGSFERMLQAKSESSESIGFGRREKKESVVAECTEEDLIQYGNVRREIAGRISQIVTLDTLDGDDFEKILESEMSPIQKMEEAHNVSLSIDKESRRKLASDAAKSGLGCRYIRSKLQFMLDAQMFDEPEKDTYSLYYE
ncbi:MAG: AAA family ATPase [Roseburia sp. 1XD42-69]